MTSFQSVDKSFRSRIILTTFSWFSLAFFLVHIGAVSSAQVILRGSDPIPLLENFTYLEDQAAKLSVEDIIRIDEESGMSTADRQDLMQRNIESNFWLRFDLINLSPHDSWVIRPSNPLLHISVYFVDQNGDITEILDRAPYSIQRFDNVEINLLYGKQGRIYIKSHAPYLVDLRINLIPHEQLYEYEVQELILVVMLSGIFLSLIVYNFFLLISLREVGYFYYLVFALVNCHLWLMALRFPPNILNLGGIPWLDLVLSYRSLAPLAVMLFTRNFLRTRDLYPKIDAMILLYIGGLLVMVFGFLINARWEPRWIAIQDSYFMLGIAILFFSAFFGLTKGFKPAVYFLLGMGSFIAGNFIYLAAGKGLIPFNFFTLYGAVIGQAAQLLLMSLALADKIRIIDRERLRYAANADFKSRLLRQISHDIANPLTVIRGTGHFLEGNPKTKNQVSRVLRSADKIHEIMRFVLKTETLDDETQIELVPVSLQEVFDDLKFLFDTPAHEKKLRIDYQLCAPDLSVLAEKTSLTNEVLGNLLSNAIKFSKPGGQIIVRAEKDTSSPSILITIEDFGVGMSPTTIDCIVQRKQIISQRGTKGETGHGYGTSLAYTYVSAFRGQLRVKSQTCDKSSGTLWEITLSNAKTSKFGGRLGLSKVWSRLRRAHHIKP